MKLELRQVSFGYGSQTVLREVNCCLENAEAIVLIGPSGGGKSTLLRLLAGLLVPTSGEIVLNDQLVPTSESALLKYRQHLGVVFQSFNLFPHLTAIENILLPLIHVHHRDPLEAEEIAQDLLQRLGLEQHRDYHPGQLSGGQRQRVAIARALAIEPRFLLLDEPTSALDPEMTAEVLGLMEKLKSRGCPFIMVTHSMAFARRVADQVVFLGQQQILEYGPANEVFSSPKTEICQRYLSLIQQY